MRRHEVLVELRRSMLCCNERGGDQRGAAPLGRCEKSDITAPWNVNITLSSVRARA